MALPTQVHIGCHTWTLTTDPTGGLTDGANCNGVTVRERLQVVVADDLAPSFAREVLLHELIHACLAGTPDFGSEAEETLVRALAPQLLGVLRNNPDVITYLLADE